MTPDGHLQPARRVGPEREAPDRRPHQEPAAALPVPLEHPHLARRRGAPAVGLSTGSRTGALDLYLDTGMVVRASYTHYSKLLSPSNPIRRHL